MLTQLLLLVCVTLTAITTAEASQRTELQEAKRKDVSTHQARQVDNSVFYHLTNRVSAMETTFAALNGKVDLMKSKIATLTSSNTLLKSSIEVLKSKRSLRAEVASMKSSIQVLQSKRCESGTTELDPYNRPVQQPDSLRRHTIAVRFSRTFSTRPWVSVSLSLIDAFNTANLRVGSGASDVTTSGFNVYAYQWHNTHLHRVRVSWIACNV